MHWELFVCDFNKPACDSLGRKCTVQSYGLQNLITAVTQSAALTKGCSTSLPGQGNASSSLIPLGLMPLAWIRDFKMLTVMSTQAEVSFSSLKFGSWATLALKRYCNPDHNMGWLPCKTALWDDSEGVPKPDCSPGSLLLCRFQWGYSPASSVGQHEDTLV